MTSDSFSTMPLEHGWHTELCACQEDVPSCLVSWRFPAAQFGLNKQRMDDSSCFDSCCAYALLQICCQCWVVHAPYRRSLRAKYGLEEAPHSDCLVVCCCPCCALAQEARELNYQQRQMQQPVVQTMNT